MNRKLVMFVRSYQEEVGVTRDEIRRSTTHEGKTQLPSENLLTKPSVFWITERLCKIGLTLYTYLCIFLFFKFHEMSCMTTAQEERNHSQSDLHQSDESVP